MRRATAPIAALLLLAALLAIACGYNVQNRVAGSVMSYLYPGQKEAPPALPVTTLRLPTVVGIAFVPESTGGLDEVTKQEPLRQVKQAFVERKDIVARIEEIPSSYLQAGGSFANLEQVRTMFGTDVVCLLGYDQLQATTETKASFWYLTIVGAFIVPGNRNDTRTMMEATVYDVASKRLLFRAPGISVVERRLTAVDIAHKQDEDQREGFRLAGEEFVKNLKASLATFEKDLANRAGEIQVPRKDAQGNWVSSAWGGAELLMVLLVGAALLLARRRHGP